LSVHVIELYYEGKKKKKKKKKDKTGLALSGYSPKGLGKGGEGRDWREAVME
jgi:hypothetical protein